MPILLKLQVFEGPMDLLMHLIEKNKIDIYDIPIVTITDQYLEYVRQMEHSDMNVTSEFLVMAATLLDIKSRMLLPREENEEGDEEDPRDELVKRLLEYKMYKFMSEELKEKSRQAGLSYFREQDLPEEVRSYVPPLNYEELIGDRTAQSLRNVFADVMKRRKSRVDPIRSGFGKIHREEISVADKTLYIRAYLQSHPHALMKHQKIRITQEEAFGKILIDLADPNEPETEALPQEQEEGPQELEPYQAPIPDEPEEEPEPILPESVTDPAPVLIHREPEAEFEPLSPELEEEPELPLSEPEAEPELLPELIPEEIEPEPVRRRHLVMRPRQNKMAGSRHFFPRGGRRTSGSMYRKARGSRIWNRKRNRGSVLRQLRKRR